MQLSPGRVLVSIQTTEAPDLGDGGSDLDASGRWPALKGVCF
jgi:hypothetical protein